MAKLKKVIDLGKFIYQLPSGSYQVSREIGDKKFYKTFKANELNKAKKYRDDLVKKTKRIIEKAQKTKGQKTKETKLKKYGTVAAGLEKRNVTVNENIGAINFKNKADEERFETAVTLWSTLPQGVSGRTKKEIDDLFMTSFSFLTSKDQMQRGRRAMMKKLGLRKPLAPKSSVVLSDSQTKKMRELKELARNTKVELDASHVANEGTQKSIYKIGLGDVPEKTTGLGGQTYFTSPSTTKATTQRLKPTFLTTSEKNEFFHKQMEDELTLLLDNRNRLLAELDEISDLKPTRKISLFKLLKQNQNQLDAIDENMKALRIFTTLKDPICL